MSRYSDYSAAPPSQQEFYEREWVEERRAERRESSDVRNAGDGREGLTDLYPDPDLRLTAREIFYRDHPVVKVPKLKDVA